MAHTTDDLPLPFGPSTRFMRDPGHTVMELYTMKLTRDTDTMLCGAPGKRRSGEQESHRKAHQHMRVTVRVNSHGPSG